MRAPVDLRGSLKHLLLRAMPWVEQAWASHRSCDLRFRVAPRDRVGRTIMRRASYEPALTNWLLQRLGSAPPTVFVDVGANIGWFSLHAARVPTVARVVAIEPDAYNHALLQVNAAANGLAERVDAVVCAAGSATAFHRLGRYRATNRGRHSILLAGDTGSWTAVVPLDELLEQIGIDPALPVALKIDVEGYEPLVLAGATATLQRCRLLMIELSPSLSKAGGLDLQRALHQLQELGFRADHWDQPGPVPSFDELRASPRQVTVGFVRD